MDLSTLSPELLASLSAALQNGSDPVQLLQQLLQAPQVLEAKVVEPQEPEVKEQLQVEGLGPEVEEEPQLQPVLEPELQPQPEPVLEPELQPQPEPVLEPELQPQPEPVLELELQPQPEPVLEPELQPQPEPVLELELQPQPEPVLQPVPAAPQNSARSVQNLRKIQQNVNAPSSSLSTREQRLQKLVELKQKREAKGRMENQKNINWANPATRQQRGGGGGRVQFQSMTAEGPLLNLNNPTEVAAHIFSGHLHPLAFQKKNLIRPLFLKSPVPLPKSVPVIKVPIPQYIQTESVSAVQSRLTNQMQRSLPTTSNIRVLRNAGPSVTSTAQVNVVPPSSTRYYKGQLLSAPGQSTDNVTTAAANALATRTNLVNQRQVITQQRAQSSFLAVSHMDLRKRAEALRLLMQSK
jgi:hypothetical protein